MCSAKLCAAVGRYTACWLVCSPEGQCLCFQLCILRSLHALRTRPLRNAPLLPLAGCASAACPSSSSRAGTARHTRSQVRPLLPLLRWQLHCGAGLRVRSTQLVHSMQQQCTSRQAQHHVLLNPSLCRRAASRGVPRGSAARAEGGRGGQRQHSSRRRERSQRRLVHARGLHLSSS